MEHCLKIEKFGKIEQAEIQPAPLTLFVGDNNSGKSYLLSLLWAIYSADESSALFWELDNLEQGTYQEIYQGISKLVQAATEGQKQQVTISSAKFLEVLNLLLEKNKGRFVAEIFNSEQVSIQKLSVEWKETFAVSMEGWREANLIIISYHNGKSTISFPVDMAKKDVAFIVSMVCRHVLLWFLKGKRVHCAGTNVVYLPAARTGFMLAKNVINKVGRQRAYDVSGLYDLDRKEEMEPFTKPIIRFLDALEELSMQYQTQHGELIAWVEREMAHGKIQYNGELNGGEIRYVPKGSGERLPLRAASAVVTELTPLLLLLKHKRRLCALCYEEPEMCLHPQLQEEMGRLLIRLVNSGIFMVATTHSDIIIQHINNMCRLSEVGIRQGQMERMGLDWEDLIGIHKVAVYQFKDKGECSVVDRVIPEHGEFQVKTFSNALMKLLGRTSEIQDFEGE